MATKGRAKGCVERLEPPGQLDASITCRPRLPFCDARARVTAIIMGLGVSLPMRRVVFA
jgi:hypothetical protein